MLSSKSSHGMHCSIPIKSWNVMHCSIPAFKFVYCLNNIFIVIAEEKLERFLSRIVLLVWMFVFLVLTSSYTASFASMLTVQQLSPTVTDVHELQRKGEYVGFHRGSYIEGLLVDIGFEKSKMRPYETQEDFAAALSKGSKDGDIAALVHEIPYIKLFLAKYSKGYTMVGPIYKSAGFAFALPKQSPLRAEMSRAILNITGEDSINEIEKKWIYQNSHQHEDKIDGSGAITFESFGGLFLLTGIVTTCSLAVAMLMNLYKKYQENAWSKEDDQNECGHRQQGANGDSQEEQGDQNSNEHGNCSDIEKQTTLKVPLSSNTE
uniref:Ionotropic glutamate receptor C-terminal domain-containing protein n=1 Tax=Aegilops tauschii subsp. strangulata TaxID=200361 RepID=A0A453KVU9_AEGTS